jgi:hypothetical protein
LLTDSEVFGEDGENDIEITDCAGFFLINHADRGTEGFVGDGENGIRTANYVRFFLVNYAGRGAVSPYSANFVVVIAAIEIASIY